MYDVPIRAVNSIAWKQIRSDALHVGRWTWSCTTWTTSRWRTWEEAFVEGRVPKEQPGFEIGDLVATRSGSECPSASSLLFASSAHGQTETLRSGLKCRRYEHVSIPLEKGRT